MTMDDYRAEIAAREAARGPREAAGLVECDDSLCLAKQCPVTREEYALAYVHWKDHTWYSGCSHGC